MAQSKCCTHPAFGHPSNGGERLKSPPAEGCRNGGVGLVSFRDGLFALPVLLFSDS